MGLDEDQARRTLLVMMELLARDPYDALGLALGADPAQVRAAFLSATKTFHPAKYARMSTDVQKLANEVFLSLRNVHDTLARPAGKAPGPRQTGAIPIVARPTSPPPPAAAAPPRPSTLQPSPLARVAPVRSVSASPHERTQPMRPFGRGTPEPDRPAPARPGASVPPRPGTPAGGVPATRPSGTIPTQRPATAPGPGPRATGGMPAVKPAAPASPADRELAPILALLEQQQFLAARAALQVLSSGAPHNARYRALIAYSKGREAQLANNIGEARVELNEALQIDPELQLAKTALGELFTRRK